MSTEYQNIHAGETCLIIGNGPSLKDIPLEFLKKYKSFGTNRIYLMDDFVPSYYVAINALVIEQSFMQILALPCPKFVRAMYATTFNAFPLRSVHDRKFHPDIENGIDEGWTVTYCCMQIAFHMGFTTALLVGVDHRYSQDGKPNQKVTATEPDPNHFDPRYFGPGVEWQCADLTNSRLAYIEADKAYKAAGRKIINLTPGTALDVFAKDDWRKW